MLCSQSDEIKSLVFGVGDALAKPICSVRIIYMVNENAKSTSLCIWNTINGWCRAVRSYKLSLFKINDLRWAALCP